MSILQIITPEEIAARWSILPDKLRGVLSSTQNKNLIVQIGSSFGITSDNLPKFEAIIAVVFMGIMDIDLMWDEFQEVFGVTRDQAYSIAERLYKELFEPYMQDIETIYAPLIPYEDPLAIQTPANIPHPSRTLDLKGAPAVLPNIPANLPSNLPPPSPAPVVASIAPKSSTEKAPAPFILQKSTPSEAVIKDSGFRLNLDPKLFAGGPSRPIVPQPPKPARLELGVTKEASGEKRVSSVTPQIAPRIVHYTAPQNPTGIAAAPAPLPKTAPTPAPVVPKTTTTASPSPVPLTSTPKTFTAPLPTAQTNAPAFEKPSPKPAIPAAGKFPPLDLSKKTVSPVVTASASPAPASLPSTPAKVVNFSAEDKVSSI